MTLSVDVLEEESLSIGNVRQWRSAANRLGTVTRVRPTNQWLSDRFSVIATAQLQTQSNKEENFKSMFDEIIPFVEVSNFDSALDCLYSHIRGALTLKKYGAVNSLFLDSRMLTAHEQIGVSFLALTWPWKHRLPNRARFLTDLENRMGLTRNAEVLEAIFHGLR